MLRMLVRDSAVRAAAWAGHTHAVCGNFVFVRNRNRSAPRWPSVPGAQHWPRHCQVLGAGFVGAVMDAALARTAALYPGQHAPSPGRLYGWGKVGGKGGNSSAQ